MESSSTRPQYWRALALLLLGTALAASIGAMASVRADEFYAELAKPAWAPAAGVFGPVWTVLYAIMAVAAWLVIRTLGWPRARPAIVLYAAQLALNASWSWLFFRWRLGGAALVEIVVLWILVLLTVAAFWRARPLAGMLLLPYVVWVSFAAALTCAIWHRNPGVL